MLWDPFCNGMSILQDPQIPSLGKLPYHVPLIPYPSAEEALSADGPSPFYRSLNGDWAFRYFPSVRLVPEAIVSADYPDEDWSSLPVPSNWQLHGYGIPEYHNQAYAFEENSEKLRPPFVDDDRNPAGVYRLHFTCPESFSGRRTILSFDGAESALIVYLNGRFIGYSANGRSTAEFDITDSLREKDENVLCAIIVSYGSGTWLECQDMWRLCGIIRDVAIYSVPSLRLFDCYAWSEMEEPYTDCGLMLEAKILNQETRAVRPVTVRAALYDAEGTKIGECEGVTENASHRYNEKTLSELWGTASKLQENCIGTAYLRLPVSHPKLWSSERPNLYTVVLNVDGQTEAVSFRHGFRRIERRGAKLYLNGRPFLLRGVNRHEFSPKTGHVVSKEEMLQDILLMKRNNINAVRASHYPDCQYWYDLCDRYGLYVMDEANVETHGISYRRNLLPGNDPRWFTAYMDRIASMVQCDKNHPSIIFYSLGNELGFGENVALGASYCRTVDPTRLIHKRQMNSVADVDSETYPSPEAMILHAKEHPDRPFIANEYGHAMGNAMGSLHEYWEAIRAHEQLAGGFIWEWCDHGLYDPARGFCYGGDFGEAFHDGNFCIDGVVTPDRRETPKLKEVKKVHEYIRLSLKDPYTLHLINEYSFTRLSDFLLEWSLLKDGAVFHTETLCLPDTAPGESLDLPLPVSEALAAEAAENADYTLRATVRYAEATPFCPAGEEASCSVFPLAVPLSRPREYVPPMEPITLKHKEGLYAVYSDHLLLNMDDTTGRITLYTVDGHSMLTDLVPSFFRAPTDNDLHSSYLIGKNNWYSYGLADPTFTLLAIDHEVHAHHIILRTSHRLGREPDGIRIDLSYTIWPDGRILVQTDFEIAPSCPIPARVGLRLTANSSLTDCVWYGLGPHETYPDRKASGLLGRYEETVDERGCGFYIRPQDYGAHEDTSLLAVQNGRWGLAVVSDPPLSMRAVAYSAEELVRFAHLFELPKPENSYVYVDFRQTGLGNRSCGPEVFPPYRVLPGKYAFAFSLIPYAAPTDPVTLKNFRYSGDYPIRTLAAPWGTKAAEDAAYQDPSDPAVRKALGFQ